MHFKSSSWPENSENLLLTIRINIQYLNKDVYIFNTRYCDIHTNICRDLSYSKKLGGPLPPAIGRLYKLKYL